MDLLYSSKKIDVNKKLPIVASKWNAELVDAIVRIQEKYTLKSLVLPTSKLFMFPVHGSLYTQLKKN
jgi:hypothetical protein